MKNKINYLNPNKKFNINNINLKENRKMFKIENVINQKYNYSNKYSDYLNKKYNDLLKIQKNNTNNNIKDNGKILNKPDINKNQFTIPFYLINIQNLYNNIINSSNTKKK